jgi:hypothetical protein
VSDINRFESPSYRGTVFISYARADDTKPPFEDKVEGWVKFFWENLRFELNDRGVHQATLWLDRYQIEPAEDFTVKIEEALKEARLIIPILSPNWVQRPWCRKEIDRFVELRPEYAKDGIIPVKKLETREEDLPLALRNREGYSFYLKDTTGKIHEFYWRGLTDRDAYNNMVRRIATWIAERLITDSLPAKSATSLSGQVVYVALAADELHDARQRIANDLEGAGHVVLPSGPPPDTTANPEAKIREALSKAVLSVHFLGENEGAKPEGSSEGLVRLQLRLARELSVASGPVPRVLWAPKWLPGHGDSKRDPFEVLTRFGKLMEGEEIFAEEVTDLSQALRSRLTVSAPTARGRVSRIVVAAGASEDDGLVGALANRLQSGGIKVGPMFADGITSLGAFGQATAVLVLWGTATKASIETLLESLVPSHAQVTVLCLPGGDETAKRRFFREGIYVEQLAEIPPDRNSARELLVRLDIATHSDPAGATR